MIELDTSNILFICGGAFVGLDKMMSKRSQGGSSIGFGSVLADKKTNFDEVEPDDLIKYGLIPELVGRLPVVVGCHDLSKPDLKAIMTDTKNSLIKQTQRLFAMEDIKLEISPEAIDYIVDEAHGKKLGARGLKTMLEKGILETQYELPTYREKGVKQVVISIETMKGGEPLLIYEKASSE